MCRNRLPPRHRAQIRQRNPSLLQENLLLPVSTPRLGPMRKRPDYAKRLKTCWRSYWNSRTHCRRAGLNNGHLKPLPAWLPSP